MVNENKYYNVKNRSTGRVVYNVPELGVRREFTPGEIKKVQHKELKRLSYQTGGLELIKSYFIIADEDAVDELSIDPEPEYYMEEAQIVELLQHGDINEFLDCLDFAPDGVLDLVKQYAVSLPLNDYEKRKALKEKLGFDVDKAIEHVEEDKESDEEEKPATRGRRTSGNKYKTTK